jgi:hypothetical protein
MVRSQALPFEGSILQPPEPVPHRILQGPCRYIPCVVPKALKTDTSVLKRPVAMLIEAKKLKKKGKKRGTKHFVS